MRRFKALACILVALLILLPGCGSMMMSDSAEGAMGGSKAFSEPNNAPRVVDNFGGGYDNYDLETSERGSAGTENRKIIWNASVDIEAEDASSLHNSLSAYAAELGGYEYTNEIQHQERYSVVRATYKIPPENLQLFLAYAGERGKVINRRLSSDDITENYTDAALRLESARSSLEQYYRFIDEAKNLDDVLKLQRIIDGIIEDIEAFEGKLRMWDVLADMATVSVYIRQENDPVKIQREINWSALSAGDMGYLIKRGFVGVGSGVLTALQWIAIALLVTAILWVPAVVVLWFWWKRRKKRRAAMPPPQPPAPRYPTPPVE